MNSSVAIASRAAFAEPSSVRGSLLERIFGWRDYVMLLDMHGNYAKRRVRWLGPAPYATKYGWDTASLLLPGGKTDGPGYVVGWAPVTPRMTEWFRRERPA